MLDMLGEQRCVYIPEGCINFSQEEHLIYCTCSSVHMFGNNHAMLLPTTNHINRFMLMYLHIRFGCKDIVCNGLWCHPPQWHLVLEGGHILGCVSGETKVWYLEQLPLIHQDVAAGQVTVEDTQGGEVLLRIVLENNTVIAVLYQ